jgi:alkanesulfonate monooxygenase SsuD/methylene tetrahydromethanopterin reductase-like flavin-dependent oxidoreductase (luciferase family)
VPIAVHGHGHIGDTADGAADEFYPSYAAAMTRIGRERGWGPMTRQQFDEMRSPDGSLVIGNPEEVAAKILRWGEVLDLDRFMLHVSVGTMHHDSVMKVIERLGTEVAPIVGGK